MMMAFPIGMFVLVVFCKKGEGKINPIPEKKKKKRKIENQIYIFSGIILQPSFSRPANQLAVHRAEHERVRVRVYALYSA